MPSVFRCSVFLAGLAAASALILALPASAGTTVVSCDFNGGSPVDLIDRGIVLPNYPGNNIRFVSLAYVGAPGGLYEVQMVIHRGTFDGPIVGTATANGSLPSSGETILNYDFGGAAVTPGDTLAITQTLLYGSGFVYFDVGNGSGCTGAYETEGTQPPLDTQRTMSVGIAVSEDTLNGGCIPDDNQMCIDNKPGDSRFSADAHFATSEGGGLSGEAGEVPLKSLGLTTGGAFWFFNQTNPEVLIKILDGCSLNNHFWVFFTAGTNVGFTVTVTDTATGHTKTYQNTDLHPAAPVQDTSAFPCP